MAEETVYINGYTENSVSKNADILSEILKDKGTIYTMDGNGQFQQLLGGGEILMTEVILDKSALNNGYRVRVIKGVDNKIIMPIYGIAFYEGATSPFATNGEVTGDYE